MKCKLFYDSLTTNAGAMFDEWAKGKMLAKDVIIHSHTVVIQDKGMVITHIIVFFDEKIHPSW